MKASSFETLPHLPNMILANDGQPRCHNGKVSSRNETIFRYKLHPLITVSGLILDFELALLMKLI